MPLPGPLPLFEEAPPPNKDEPTAPLLILRAPPGPLGTPVVDKANRAAAGSPLLVPEPAPVTPVLVPKSDEAGFEDVAEDNSDDAPSGLPEGESEGGPNRVEFGFLVLGVGDDSCPDAEPAVSLATKLLLLLDRPTCA